MPESRGVNLVLASGLALLSYVPFEYVAKGALLASAFLFVIDPIPPLSRIISIASLLVVFGLTRLYNQHKQFISSEDEIIVEEQDTSKKDDRSKED